jgi:hypothetical protein
MRGSSNRAVQKWSATCNIHLREELSMFIGLFAVLLVLWLLGFFAFHVAGGLIHLLLIVAVVALVLHFVRGGRAVA